MPHIYIADVSSLNTDISAETSTNILLGSLSEHRKNKFLSQKSEESKKLSLGCSLLLKIGLKIFGLEEKFAQYKIEKNGKPYISNAENVFFSLSHTDNIAVAALDSSEIGVDSEKLSRKIEDKIIRRYFSEKEQNWTLGDYKQKLKLWVSKESIVKYTGEGFAVGAKKHEIPRFDQKTTVNGISVEIFNVLGTLIALSSKSDTETHLHIINLTEVNNI